MAYLGDPLPGVEVNLCRRWPARPASLADDGLELVVRPAQEGPMTRLRTDERGRYHVEAVPEEGAVDLWLWVSGGELWSEVLRVPLPLPPGELPDLVAQPVRTGLAWASGEHGQPLRASVELDGGPGSVRAPELRLVAGPDGRLLFPRRPLEWWMRVEADGRGLVSAHAGDVPLAPEPEPWLPWTPLPDDDVVLPEPEWIRVPADAASLELGFALLARVSGVVRAGFSGRPLAAARVRLRHDGRLVAAGSSAADGWVEIALPPVLAGQWLALEIDAAGHEPLRTEVLATDDPLHLGEPWYLLATPEEEALAIPASRKSIVHGQPGSDDARAFRWPGEWPTPGVHPVDRAPGWQRLDILPGPGGQPRVALPGNPADAILVVQRDRSVRDLPALAHWGPVAVAEARGAIARPTLLGTSGTTVLVENASPERPVDLARLSWDPWFDRVDAALVRHRAGGLPGAWDEQRVDVPLSRGSAARFELWEERQPVFRWLCGQDLAWSGEPARPAEELTLVAPRRATILGSVVDQAVDDWPDTCVALLGPGTTPGRWEALGAWDEWARPDRQGRFRFEGVVAGPYELVLYRVLDDRRVEILAQRSVSVERTVFQLDIWSDVAGSPARRILDADGEAGLPRPR